MANPLIDLQRFLSPGTPVSNIIVGHGPPSPSFTSVPVNQMYFDDVGRNTFMYNGAKWEQLDNPLCKYDALSPPTVNDDVTVGYALGSQILIPSTSSLYMCTDPAAGAAVWFLVTAGGGGGIPAIGASTDRALVLWNGAGGGSVLNSNATLSGGGALTLATPLAVASGGLGVNSLTSGGILLGNGVGAVAVTGQPTSGQLLIGRTGLDPVLGSLTAGANISITPGSGSITIAATGITSGDVVGPASAVSNHIALFDGVTGKLLKDSAAVSIDASSNITGVNNLTVGGAFVLSADQVQTPEGGTGVGSFNVNGVVMGNGTSALYSTAALGNGELLIGSFGAPPVATSLTAGSNITITPGAGSITIASTASGGLSYNAVAGTTQTMVANNAYQNDNVGLTTFTLPATAAKGSRLEIIGFGSGGWVVAQPAGASIIVGSLQSTVGVGGSIASTNRYDNVELVCVVADTTWKEVDMQGNIDVV